MWIRHSRLSIVDSDQQVVNEELSLSHLLERSLLAEQRLCLTSLYYSQD